MIDGILLTAEIPFHFIPVMTFKLKIFAFARDSSPWCCWRRWKGSRVSVQWKKSALHKVRWFERQPFCLSAQSFRVACKQLPYRWFEVRARGNGSRLAKYLCTTTHWTHYANWVFLPDRSAYGRMRLLHFQWPLDRCTGDCYWISLSFKSIANYVNYRTDI